MTSDTFGKICQVVNTHGMQEQILSALERSQLLFIDTEIADHLTKHPRLRLIQILAEPDDDEIFDFSSLLERVIVVDCYENESFLNPFRERILMNEEITKVFHNSPFDLRWLEAKGAPNIVCTLSSSRSLPRFLHGVENHKLSTLYSFFSGSDVAVGGETTPSLSPAIETSEPPIPSLSGSGDSNEYSQLKEDTQGSDWSRVPLTESQVYYAKCDCVVLRHVYHSLLKVENSMTTESLELRTRGRAALESEFAELESEMKCLTSRHKFVKNLLTSVILGEGGDDPEEEIEGEEDGTGVWQYDVVERSRSRSVIMASKIQILSEEEDFEVAIPQKNIPKLSVESREHVTKKASTFNVLKKVH